VGTATLQDKNQNDAGSLVVDLTADRDHLDRFGRPTQLSWSLTPFTGSGGFSSGAFSLATGAGTVQVRYRDSGPARGVTSEGDATVVFQGSLYTPGTTFPLANSGLQSAHRRPGPF
jgi:hypothetical protein